MSLYLVILFKELYMFRRSSYTAWSAVVYDKSVAMWSCGLVSGGWYCAVRPPIALSESKPIYIYYIKMHGTMNLKFVH
jgi:hypothetical protein